MNSLIDVFKPRQKIADFETETSLPGFSVDANGFVIFDNHELGGCGIFEVSPKVMECSITHRDSIRRDVDTFSEGYEPTLGMLFGDARRQTYPGWVHFLNSLGSLDESDEDTHIQILAKKCRSDTWNTQIDYAIEQSSEVFEEAIREHGWHDSTPHGRTMLKRFADYNQLLEDIRTVIESSDFRSIDYRRLPSYKIKYYMIVPYAPTSEGWWMDGRDSEYYVSDNISPTSMFSKEDKLVENFVDMLMSKRIHKSEKSENNLADMFWYIDSDRTAQIIHTRMQKLEDIISDWNHDAAKHPKKKSPMPFSLRRLSIEETSALICFFPNILTAYASPSHLTKLKVNYNDVYYDLNNKIAISRHDASQATKFAKDIALGSVDLSLSKDAEEEWLKQFNDNDASELESSALSDWERDHFDIDAEMLQEREDEEYEAPATESLWASLDSETATREKKKTPEELEREYLAQFDKYSYSADEQKFINDVKASKNNKK